MTILSSDPFSLFLGQPTITYSDGSVNSHWSHGSAVGNRFMFQGREYLNEIGLFDFRHRLYNPDTGRFLQTDPLGLQTEGEKLSVGQKALFSPGGSAPEAFGSSEMNLFRYCGDDPVAKSDPLGLKFLPSEEEVDSIVEAPSRFGRTNSDMQFKIDAFGSGKSWKLVLTRFDVYAKSRIATTHDRISRSPGAIGATKVHEKLHRDKYEEFYKRNEKLPNKTYGSPEEADAARHQIGAQLKAGLKETDRIEDSHPPERFRKIEMLERR
jgi:RHS repeat-associated protein